MSTSARIIQKKISTHTHSDANGHMHHSDTFYIIFELDTGSTVKFSVGHRIYRIATEYEWGTLTFQGTRFLKFESISGVIEK